MATSVFVYGTLRPEQPNFMRYLSHEGAKLVQSDVYTWPEFVLASINDFFPAMVQPDEKNKEYVTAVVGDVFQVDSPTLRALDKLEGVPFHYQRQHITLANGMNVQAYIINPTRVPKDAPVIRHGDWVRYISEVRPHRGYAGVNR